MDIQDHTLSVGSPVPIRQEPKDTLFLFLLTLGLVLASGFLFFTHNSFSYRCHIDEPGKVLQIQTGERNYHHPMLMLNVTQAAFALSGMAPTPQKIAWMGRTVTAFFSLLTVLAFSYAAFLAAGRVAAVLCGVFLLGSPLFLEVSHYFKEDPAMMMGIAVSFLAIALYQRKPGIATLFSLGLGAALACSGKHLGMAILPFCLYTIFKDGRGARHLVVFLATTLGLYALINYQAVIHAAGFFGGIDREVAAIKQGGSVPVKHASPFLPLQKYSGLLRANNPFPLFWFLGFGVYVWAKQRPRKTPFGPALLFAVVIFVALALTPKTAGRYALPVVCTLSFVAAIGAAHVFAKPGWAWKIAGFALPLAVVLGMEISCVTGIYQGFRKDTRLEMAQWITRELPGDAVIAQDEDGLLETCTNVASDSPYKVPQKLYRAGVDMESSSLDVLRANGVRYFVLISKKQSIARKKKAAVDSTTDQALSSQLAKCKKIWSTGKKKMWVPNVSPNIALYELPASGIP